MREIHWLAMINDLLHVKEEDSFLEVERGDI